MTTHRLTGAIILTKMVSMIAEFLLDPIWEEYKPKEAISKIIRQISVLRLLKKSHIVAVYEQIELSTPTPRKLFNRDSSKQVYLIEHFSGASCHACQRVFGHGNGQTCFFSESDIQFF